jgi:methylmalonyl-CoA mutase
VLKVDNAKVRKSQIERLGELKAARNQGDVERCLKDLEERAKSGENLMEAAVAAGRARATVGEMSLALERVFGRYEAQIRSVTGVYAREMGDSAAVDSVHALVAEIVERDGRRPRILLAKMGQDGHDRGQKVIATALSDLGFDVDIGPLFQTPDETARQAVDNDVHVVGVSSLAAGHLTLVPQLKAELASLGRPDVLIVVGGVVPPEDVPTLLSMGAVAVFGPGTVIGDAARDLASAILKTLPGERSAEPKAS